MTYVLASIADVFQSFTPDPMSIFNKLLTQLSAPKTEPSSDRCELVVLEQRVLYSAVPVPVDAVDVVEVVEDFEAESEDCHFAAGADGLESCFGEIFEAIDSLALEEDAVPSTSELIVVDTSLEGYEILVADILSSSDPNRNFEIVYIDQDEDGIQKLTQVFEDRQGLDAVHLVTHGNDGELELGASTLDIDSLNESESAISQWRFALNRDADILIYGCNVAETESGEAFVQLLSDIVETDVAASVDLTGHVDLGGDWDFEFQVGQIEATNAFSVDAQANWQGTLETTNAASQDGTAGSLAISENGDVVFALTSSEFDGSVGEDVYYRSIILGQDELSDPIRINDTVEGDQNEVSVAVAANGNTVFVWSSNHTGSDGVYAKVIAADGSVILSEFELEAGSATNASVDTDLAGNFVVTWQATNSVDADQGVFAQVFDSAGNEIGDVQTVNTTIVGQQGNADVSLNNEGEFVIVWDDFVDRDTSSSTYYRQFDVDFATGTVTGSSQENLSGDDSGLSRRGAAVDLSDEGIFAVAYTQDSTSSGQQDTNIAAKIVDIDSGVLNSLGGSIANLITDGPQENPSIVILADDTPDDHTDNTVVLAWEGQTGQFGEGAYFRRFSGDGGALQGDTLQRSQGSNVALASFDEGTSFLFGAQEGLSNQQDEYIIFASDGAICLLYTSPSPRDS